MPATLRDVARRAGVSVRSVSNVVNGHHQVSTEMRTRVQRAIDELDYRPNVLARNLRQGKTGIISLVLPELDVPYFAELARLVIDVASERGYRVLVEQTGGEIERERELLVQGSATAVFDGVIFSPVELGHTELRTLRDDRPLVLLGERQGGGNHDHLAIDNVSAAMDATTHLIDIGRRRIAAIGDQEHDTARLRTVGYRTAHRRAGLSVDDSLIVPTHRFHRVDGAAAVRSLLALAEPPDAVFCYADPMALGAIRAIRDAGLQVPDDIAVVGIDDIDDGAFAVPSLTTIAPDKRFIATRAVERLVARIADPELAAEEIIAPHRLVVRESTGG